MGVFDLTGGPFLQLYAVLFVLVFVVGLIIPRWLRPDGGSPHGVSTDQLAYLTGGQGRFSDTVVSRLLASGDLTLAGTDEFRPQTSGGATAAERSVLALSPPASWREVSRALARPGADVKRSLVSSGLLIDSSTAWQLRFWQTTPYLLLIAFGMIKWNIGVERGRPVGFLTMFLIVTAVFALIRFASVDRRTRAGKEALANARAKGDRIRRAPAADETDLAVALFGMAVLAGSGWAAYHQMRTASSSSDGSYSSSSDSGSSGCSSSGCGGGGCGGCGS